MGFVDRGGPWVVGQVILFALILIAGWAGWASFEPLSTAGTITFWVGIGIAILAFMSLGQNLTPYPEPLADAELIERGPYRLVRHPIYTGVILTFTGFSIRAGSWIALGVTAYLIAFFWLKTNREEAGLRRKYPGYRAYSERVRARLIPFLL